MVDKTIEWLLENENPSVRFFTLTKIMKLDPSDSQVQKARQEILKYEPVQKILSQQDKAGWWNNTENATMPMYLSTAWQLMLLAELGADSSDGRIRKAVDLVFAKAQAPDGSFPHEGSRWQKQSPMDLICNDGMIAFGLLGVGTNPSDERMGKTIEFLAGALANTDYKCRFNRDTVCAWGVIKALRVLALVPRESRSPLVKNAIERGVQFILEKDLAKAEFPYKPGGSVSAHWFKLGWPRSYQADILQTMVALTDLGYGEDRRLKSAKEFLRSKILPDRGWPLEETWNKFPMPFIKTSKRQSSKWITWQAEYVLGEK